MTFGLVLLLVFQTVFAVKGVSLLWRRVYPSIAGFDSPALISDVWLPLIIAGPLLVIGGRVGNSVAGFGWLPVGASVCVGMGMIGAVLIMARTPVAGALPLRQIGAPALAGVVLLMLALSNELTMWTGQCAFALAAVLLWMNTPAATPPRRDDDTERTGWAVLGALVCAVGQAGAGYLAVGAAPIPVATILVLSAFGAGIGAVRMAGPVWATRLAVWTATIGTLMGIGLLSVLDLFPQDVHIARGFATYALEGSLLLLMPIVLIAALPQSRGPRIALGITLVAAVATLTAWRLTRM